MRLVSLGLNSGLDSHLGHESLHVLVIEVMVLMTKPYLHLSMAVAFSIQIRIVFIANADLVVGTIRNPSLSQYGFKLF